MSRLHSRDLDSPPERPHDVEEGSVVSIFRVPPECAGMRLDRFVQSQLKRTSRTRAQVIVRNSAYGTGGRRLRTSDRVTAEQLILLWRPPWDEEETDTILPILHEDEQLIVVAKPPMIPVHPTARYFRSTVVKLLERDRPGERHYLAHRLDRETSGVLLLSKTAEADRHVKRQFAGIDPETGRTDSVRRVVKHYLAIVRGWPGDAHFRIEDPLEPDVDNPLRVKMRIAAPGTGLVSATSCELLGRRVRRETGERYALIRCGLETGRQHQIRVHLSARGYPLVGDKLYGDDDRLHARAADGELSDDDREGLELPRHALHAHALELDHPLTGERIRVESGLWDDLDAFWRALDEATSTAGVEGPARATTAVERPRPTGPQRPRGTLSRST
jgi:23S rRNA pseudouridine1911/1915/1917 synthase